MEMNPGSMTDDHGHVATATPEPLVGSVVLNSGVKLTPASGGNHWLWLAIIAALVIGYLLMKGKK